MKVLIMGRNSRNIASLIKHLGLEIVISSPDVIISYGGDGTLLSAERAYPGVPKLPIRDSLICTKCSNHDEKILLKNLLENRLKLQEYKKIHTSVFGKDLYALNDFVIRNKEQIHSIRFKILTADIPGKLLIGDGIVVVTPFGSTGYFKSITGESIANGFAIALNNVTEKNGKTIYADQDEIGFQLVRGKAILTYDNNPDSYPLPEGTKLTFQLSDLTARIYNADTLRCPNCEVRRG